MRRRADNGFILILTVVVICILIGIFAFIIQNSYRRMMVAELQAAVDAAAHAGAKSYTSTVAGYDNARSSAVKQLLHETIHRGIGRSPVLPADLNPSAGPVWDAPGDFTVTVVRGAWWPKGAPDTDGDGKPGNGYGDKFIAFEDLSGQPLAASTIAPSLPPFLAANAAFVKVTLKDARAPLNFWGGIEISAQAIAVGGALGEVTTAPFAIPACALLAGAADYSPQNRCQHDLYFTRRDRYCPPDDPRCGVKPGFFATLGATGSTFQISEQCAFATDNLSADYLYGLVVGPDQFTSEAAIRGNDFRIMTEIGGHVTVKDAGFTEFESALHLGVLMSNEAYTTKDMLQSQGAGVGYTIVSRKPNGTCDDTNYGWGACNTTGFSYYDDNWVSNSFNNCDAANILPSATNVIQRDFGQLWPGPWNNDAYHGVAQVKASVVVWNGMGDCAGMSAEGQDPLPPPPGAELTVVGFIDINIYGVDIGEDPPHVPDMAYAKGHWYWQDSMEQCRSCSQQCQIAPDCESSCSNPNDCPNNCATGPCASCPSRSACSTACGNIQTACTKTCDDAESTCENGCPLQACQLACSNNFGACSASCQSSNTQCVTDCAGDEACLAQCAACQDNCQQALNACQESCNSCAAGCVSARNFCADQCSTDKIECEAQCDNCSQLCEECKADCTHCADMCADYDGCMSGCELMQQQACTYRAGTACNRDSTESTHSPWGFHPPVASTEANFRCNVVRARTACQDDFLPAIQNGRGRTVSIVR